MAEAPADLGLLIRRARERKRWSQQRLATEIGVGARSVGRWERGEAMPRSAIGALELALGVSLADGEARLTPAEQKLWDAMAYMDNDEQRWRVIYASREGHALTG